MYLCNYKTGRNFISALSELDRIENESISLRFIFLGLDFSESLRSVINDS